MSSPTTHSRSYGSLKNHNKQTTVKLNVHAIKMKEQTFKSRLLIEKALECNQRQFMCFKMPSSCVCEHEYVFNKT